MSTLDTVTLDPLVIVALINVPGPIIIAMLQLRAQQEQRRIGKKVAEAHHTLTTNAHASARPTIPDRLDDLGKAISGIRSWQERHEKQHQSEHRFYGYPSAD